MSNKLFSGSSSIYGFLKNFDVVNLLKPNSLNL